VGVRNDVAVFARLDGDTGERDRLCRFRRPRDLAQIIRRSHSGSAPAWEQLGMAGNVHHLEQRCAALRC